ncbi:MAG TPA: hypothetical protein PKW57_06525 [Anaerolineaceae bacterium]|jgi:hypothetical protein|nr:hypothetical protein [Anaerolineaceae bacterium]HPS33142.1 hypothetical protein [Anaerolineaceae bacterium]
MKELAVRFLYYSFAQSLFKGRLHAEGDAGKRCRRLSFSGKQLASAARRMWVFWSRLGLLQAELPDFYALYAHQ